MSDVFLVRDIDHSNATEGGLRDGDCAEVTNKPEGPQMDVPAV